MTCLQESVYHHTTKFLVHGVLDGFNATVFAYGNTGAGKVGLLVQCDVCCRTTRNRKYAVL